MQQDTFPDRCSKQSKSQLTPKKAFFLLCLDDMLQDYTDIDTDDSQEWMELVDRGGLKHVISEGYSINGARTSETSSRECSATTLSRRNCKAHYSK